MNYLGALFRTYLPFCIVFVVVVVCMQLLNRSEEVHWNITFTVSKIFKPPDTKIPSAVAPPLPQRPVPQTPNHSPSNHTISLVLLLNNIPHHDEVHSQHPHAVSQHARRLKRLILPGQPEGAWRGQCRARR